MPNTSLDEKNIFKTVCSLDRILRCHWRCYCCFCCSIYFVSVDPIIYCFRCFRRIHVRVLFSLSPLLLNRLNNSDTIYICCSVVAVFMSPLSKLWLSLLLLYRILFMVLLLLLLYNPILPVIVALFDTVSYYHCCCWCYCECFYYCCCCCFVLMVLVAVIVQ